MSLAGRRPYFVILLVFVLSRLAFHAAGVRFMYEHELNTLLQYLDPRLLATDLWRSILYLHMQPPLFNIAIGLVLKLFGASAGLAFHAGFMLCSLAVDLMLYRMMRLLGVPTLWALFLACVYVVAPSQIIYENYFFYSCPVAALVTATAWCLLEFMASRRAGWAHGMAWSLAALCLLRGVYTPLLFALPLYTVASLFGFRRAARIVGLPLALVLLWYVKNLAMFGFFGSSSWAGMNVAHIAVYTLPPKDADTFYKTVNDPLLSAGVFPVYRKFRNVVPAWSGQGPPAFTEPYKSNGECNLNYGAYIGMSQHFARLAWQAVRDYPGDYLRNVHAAFAIAGAPSERYHYAARNLEKIHSYTDWYDMLVWLSPYPLMTNPAFRDMNICISSMTCVLLFPLCLMLWWRRCFLEKSWRTQPFQFHAMLFLSALILYLLCVNELFDIGENNRFRFEWEPLLVAIIAMTPFQRHAGKKPA